MSLLRDATIARIWEFPYVYVKGHVDGDGHGPDEELAMLAQTEMERLIPEEFWQDVNFLVINARNTDKSDPMNNGGYYGWWYFLKTDKAPDKIVYAQHDHHRSWAEGFRIELTTKREGDSEYWVHCKCGEPIIKYITEGLPVSGSVLHSADFDHVGMDIKDVPGSPFPRCSECNTIVNFMTKYLYPLRQQSGQL